MPITFWVRETSNTAQADTLVIGNDAAVQMTLTDDSPFVAGVDSVGDLVLEGGGVSTTFGTMDADTWAIVGGTTYRVVYDAVSTLPVDNKVPDSLEGDPVYVVRLYSLSDPPTLFKSYFFSPESATTVLNSQAVMDGFRNGNLQLGAALNPPPVYVCFCRGTDIATPAGSRKVEGLRAGDTVTTGDGSARKILWVGSTRLSPADLQRQPDQRPIRIAANAIAQGLPQTDLTVSPQHRILFEGPACELMFGEPAVLVAAKHLVGTLAEVARPTGDVEYFHILLADHDMLISNGLLTESFQPARRTMDVMGPASRLMLEAVIAALGEHDLLTRQDGFPSLKRHEARSLMQSLSAGRASARVAAREAEPACSD
jgi:Hint domain